MWQRTRLRRDVFALPNRPNAAAGWASLVLSGLLFLSNVGLGFAQGLPLRALNWLDASADVESALTSRPAECLTIPSDPEEAARLRLGRVAFRSPVLLGGLAARVGLRCDSCHRNGHDNPMFFFPGVSGDPGTADVTNSVFSTTRDDRIDNPVEIPSLRDAAAFPPFGTVVPASDLTSFLRAAIVDEFQGQAPSDAVLRALEVYLRALKQSDCPDLERVAISFDASAQELLGTFDVVVERVERDDLLAGEFALLSLQALMERVYERFPIDVTAREELAVRSRSLFGIRRALRRLIQDRTRRDPQAPVPTLIAELDRDRMDVLGRLASEHRGLIESLDRLRKSADQSFYNVGFLRNRLSADR